MPYDFLAPYHFFLDAAVTAFVQEANSALILLHWQRHPKVAAVCGTNPELALQRLGCANARNGAKLAPLLEQELSHCRVLGETNRPVESIYGFRCLC
jgi:hypothetical protein